jgi:acetylglutamate kinase
VNINADEIALELAVALGAGALVFLSDTPGVLRGREVIPGLSESSAEAQIAAGTIVGGMIPKVRASLQAVARGVGTICIGQFSGAGDMRKLLDGTIGTHIT